MASDSNLNAFSRYFFDVVPVKGKILSSEDVDEYDRRACTGETKLEDIFDPRLLLAPLTVGYLYGNIFRNSINSDKTKYNINEDFRGYIRRKCSNENWFGKTTIFERFFATVSFVLTCSEYSFSDINYAQVWEEYFNEHTEEFYNEGGWRYLRRRANSYVRVHDLIRMVNPAQDSLDFLLKLTRSIQHYTYFAFIQDIQKVQFKENKEGENENERQTSASLWIKFIVNSENATSFDASCSQPPKNPSEVACLLRSLKILCDPFGWRASNSKSSLDPWLSQKSINPTNSSQGNIQKPCSTEKKNFWKGEPHESRENSNFSEATEKKSSNSFNNVTMQDTAVEKDTKDCGTENLTEGEIDGKDNVPSTSSMTDEALGESDGWITVGRKRRSKVTDEKAYFEVAMGQASGGEDDWTSNAPSTSSMADEVSKKCTKKKRNRKKKQQQGANKSIEHSEVTRQVSSHSITNDSVQNTAVEEEHKNDRIQIFTEGNKDETDDEPNTSSRAGEMLNKSNEMKRNLKKVGLQNVDKNLDLKEATVQESSSSNTNNGSVQKNAVEKENGTKGSSRVNVAQGENEETGNLGETCLMN